MTRVYDFPETDRSRFIYHFGGLSPEEAIQIKAEEAEKAARKKAAASLTEESGVPVVKSTIPGKLPIRKPVTPEEDTPSVEPQTPPESKKTLPPGLKKLPVRKEAAPPAEEAPREEPKVLPKLKKPIIRRPEDPPQP